MRKLDSTLHDSIASLVGSMGYELLGGEVYQQGGQQVCRLYIDSEKGVTADDCSKVSRQVSAMFDVEDPFEGRYTLEVSSPGIDRPLFTLAQYERYVGKQLKIRLQVPVQEKRQFKGILLKVEGESIYLRDEMGAEVCLPFTAIDKANVIGEVRF